MLTTVTRAVLAVATGLTLAVAAAPVASAQDNPEDIQPTLIRVFADCAVDGKADVKVVLDDLGPYKVSLDGFTDGFKTTPEFDEDYYGYTITFVDVPVGEYVVRVDDADAPSDGAPVQVKACEDRKPSQPELTVDVECQGGWGVAHFEVTNPDTGDSRAYTLTVSKELSLYEENVLPGMFLRITENQFDDGVYTAFLSGDGLAEPISEEFTVKCAPKDQPTVISYARCDDKDDLNAPAVVRVTIGNPNRHPTEYVVTAGDVTTSVTVAVGWHKTVELGPFPAGVYPVSVIGPDGMETPAHVLVDYCEDIVPDKDGLQVSVRCVDGQSVVTARFFPHPGKRVFTVDDRKDLDAIVEPDTDGFYDWIRYEGVEDGTYSAALKAGDDVLAREEFTVDCVEDEPTPTTDPTTTTAPPTSADTTVPTTTDGPPPQGSPGPVDDLPVTGAAVTSMVVLGLAALGLGGGLVLAARRKRA